MRVLSLLLLLLLDRKSHRANWSVYAAARQAKMEGGIERRHTLGIGAVPLNLLLTALSIPFGFRQFGLTHLKRSLWWRLKRLVPVLGVACQSRFRFPRHRFRIRSQACEAVGERYVVSCSEALN